MLNNNTSYKYETPYKGPFVINQFWTNITVTLQCCAIKIRPNGHKVGDITPEKCVTMSTYGHQLYTSVFHIKYWKQGI